MGTEPLTGMEIHMTAGAVMAISDKLKKIQARAASLNAKTDDFNATIDYIETQLRGSGVEFWWLNGPRLSERIVKDNEHDLDLRDHFALGYVKVGDEWHLAAQRWRSYSDMDMNEWSNDGTTADPVALKDAPRRVRMEAADSLEEFLDAYEQEMARVEAKIDKANALVKSSTDPKGKR
jgi:hypothetical protein